MKTRLLTALILAAAAAGCHQPDTSVDIGNAFPLDKDCKQDNTISQVGGSMNVALTQSFRISFDVSSSLQPVDVSTTSGTTIKDSTVSEAIVEEVRYTYASSPDLGLGSVSDPIHLVVAPNSTDRWIALNLFPGAAGDQLAAGVVPGDRVEVSVGVQLAGKLRSGASFTSNSVNFPVTVENVACGTGMVRPTSIAGPCGNLGQDGFVEACCPSDTPDCVK
jgi:hypothetical protein